MRRFILIVIALAILAAAIFYVDFSTLWSALAGLTTITLILLALQLVVSALVKSVRWAFYLRAAKLDISWRDGMTTYLAGMAAGAIPGGSWLPARLAHDFRQAAPRFRGVASRARQRTLRGSHNHARPARHHNLPQ